jgi:predicted RNase H-like HicB family nuclease
MTMEYAVKYELGRDGWWVTSIPAVPGCHTQGKTLPQARERIRECLGLYDDDAASAKLIDKIELPPQISEALQRISSFGLHGVDVEILLDSHPA